MEIVEKRIGKFLVVRGFEDYLEALEEKFKSLNSKQDAGGQMDTLTAGYIGAIAAIRFRYMMIPKWKRVILRWMRV